MLNAYRPFRFDVLALGNSIGRAVSCACAAIDADICINYVLGFALRNGADGTILSAGPAGYAISVDDVCHNRHLRKVYD